MASCGVQNLLRKLNTSKVSEEYKHLDADFGMFVLINVKIRLLCFDKRLEIRRPSSERFLQTFFYRRWLDFVPDAFHSLCFFIV